MYHPDTFYKTSVTEWYIIGNRCTDQIVVVTLVMRQRKKGGLCKSIDIYYQKGIEN
jgi:hypothetical protein